MFVGFGLSAILPVLHGTIMYGFEQMRYSIGLDWVLLQGILYLLGAMIYAVCPYSPPNSVSALQA